MRLFVANAKVQYAIRARTDDTIVVIKHKRDGSTEFRRSGPRAYHQTLLKVRDIGSGHELDSFLVHRQQAPKLKSSEIQLYRRTTAVCILNLCE